MKIAKLIIYFGSLVGAIGGAESADDAAFKNLYSKVQLTVAPSAAEIQSKIDDFNQWKSLVIAHMRKFEVGPPKLLDSAEAYDEEARRSSGDMQKIYRRTADLLHERAGLLAMNIAVDVQKVKLSDYEAVLSELKEKGS